MLQLPGKFSAMSLGNQSVTLNSVTSPTGGPEPTSVETDIDTLMDNPPESFDLVEMFNV